MYLEEVPSKKSLSQISDDGTNVAVQAVGGIRRPC